MDPANVDGRRLLLFDDVYASGARSQGAAAALTNAGADVAGIVVLGRRYNPAYSSGVRDLWLRQSGRQRGLSGEPFWERRTIEADNGPNDLASGLGRVGVLDLLADLLGQLGVAEIETVELPSAPRLQDRVTVDAELDDILRVVDQLRSTVRVPFWDAVLTVAINARPEVSEALLYQATFHLELATVGDSRTISFTEAFDEEQLARAIESTAPDRILALRSRVRTTDGDEAHLPQIDFQIPASPRDLAMVSASLKANGLRGWILESGRSYHFYGVDLLRDAKDFERFLGRVALLSPIVDQRWVAHQLIEGASALRISSGGDAQIPPQVVIRI